MATFTMHNDGPVQNCPCFDVGYVKYGYPIAVTTMMLAWGLIEFPQVSLIMAYGLQSL